MCTACKSVPTLHVAVGDTTPRSTWPAQGPQTDENTTSSDACISSRVPIVRTLHSTWVLPVGVLIESAAVELWEKSELFWVMGTVPAGSLDSVVWPKGLKELALDARLVIPVEAVRRPGCLEKLQFGDNLASTSQLPGLFGRPPC